MLPIEFKKYIQKIVTLQKSKVIDTVVPVSWKVFDEKEIENAVQAVLDCHWTEWRFNQQFEEKLWKYLWAKHVITTNSWSSANLLAFTALTAKELKERRIMPWDEVICVAAGFPTTITPIIQNSCVPVFVDIDKESYEIDVEEIKKALTPKSKAIMIAHTLWNTFDIDAVQKICKDNNLWLIEDSCDALGTRYNGKYTGTFWDIATFSFYPAHHITMWEWGALITNDTKLKKIIKSYRDWWRDCWCNTWEDNSCNNRFNWKLWELPHGFDHKYIYSRIWYNLKITDMQAAIWLAQLDKLDDFTRIRKDNFSYLKNAFIKEWFDAFFDLPSPTENADVSWFWFILSLKKWQNFSREELLQFLNNNNIGSRLLFAWNYLKQPAFLDYVDNYRVVGDLKNTNHVMHNTFWIGVHQWLTKHHLDYVILKFKEFLHER